MKITTAWLKDGDEDPWMVSGYCENTEDIWQGVPEWYTEEVEKARKGVPGVDIREIRFIVPDSVIEDAFAPQEVEVRATLAS